MAFCIGRIGSYCTNPAAIQSDPLEVLQELEAALNLKIRGLDHRIESLSMQGKQCLHDTERARALAILVQEHRKTRSKYVQMHLKVSQMVLAIQSTHDSVEILGAYKLGSETLHSVLSRVSMDDVEDILDELSNRMDDSVELQEALSRPIVEMSDEEELMLPSPNNREVVSEKVTLLA